MAHQEEMKASASDPSSHEAAGQACSAPEQGAEGDVFFKPGDVIAGQFEVVRTVGRGGMGVVYEVVDRLTRQRLALKTIRPSLVRHPRIVETFVREVTLARRLRHPGIVAVFDVRQEGPLLFFTMEYLEGRTLRAVLAERGLLALKETVEILGQLCSALEHAHQLTVHCDISPENVMVLEGGVKLLDFGIAKALDLHTASHRAVGKTFYTAPEQREDWAKVDARADIYALGILFYEMLTGKRLNEPLPLDAELPQLSEPCRAVVVSTVAPLERRLTSAQELRLLLEQCLSAGGDGSRTAPIAGPEASAQPGTEPAAQRSAAPHQWLSLLVVVAAAAFSLFLGAYFLREWASPGLPTRPIVSVEPREETAPASSAQPSPRAPPALLTQAARWQAADSKGNLLLPGGEEVAFVRIRPGTFLMGHDGPAVGDAAPAHEVTITKGFWIGAYEVTQSQWTAIMRTEPWRARGQALAALDAPAVGVSWDEVKRFLDRLNTLGAGTFRLPTEAEWEFACRAGTPTVFCFGDDPSDSLLGNYAWYYDNTKRRQAAHAQPVGKKRPNSWGLYDVHGNVSEWCADWHGSIYYTVSPPTDPTGPSAGVFRVVRGGSWNNFAKDCTSYRRDKESPSSSRITLGFRLCRDL